jgi:hypothetical protein
MSQARKTYRTMCHGCNFVREATSMNEAATSMFNHAVATGHPLTCDKIVEPDMSVTS